MSTKIGHTLGVAIGAAFVGTLSLNQLAAASPAFQANDLASGYLLAAAPEGKCGLAKMDTNKDGKVSLEEAKAAGLSEAEFKAIDTNGDGFLDAAEFKAHHAAMHAHKSDAGVKKDASAKASEGSCGGHKDAEGSCGGMRG